MEEVEGNSELYFTVSKEVEHTSKKTYRISDSSIRAVTFRSRVERRLKQKNEKDTNKKDVGLHVKGKQYKRIRQTNGGE